MSEKGPKVEFALGSEVSSEHYFKSSFARSFVTNCRDAKSLDPECMDNGITEEESETDLLSDSKNNNFFSLMNFVIPNGHVVNTNGPQSSTWQTFNEAVPSGNNRDIGELEKLRKQCQTLTEENRKLTETLESSKVPRTQMIDNVLLQSQIDTLKWQLKQTESNRQMYRSLMGQILRFLERARKSLDILHEKNNPKGKMSSRVPRSRSVQEIDNKEKKLNGTKKRESEFSTPSPTSNNRQNSRFTRAKSVAQIAPQNNGTTNAIRDFTWSVLRKNDPGHCTPPRTKKKEPAEERKNAINQTHVGVVYRRPQYPAEIDPDNVPPEKLSQEAFRLMRTVQSLLAMREPDLARISSNEEEISGSMQENELASLRSSSFTNSTLLNDTISYNGGCSSSDRGSTGSGPDSERAIFSKSTTTSTLNSTLDTSNSSTSTMQTLIPRARRSIDATSINSNSGSSKTTEEDDEEEEDGRTTNSLGSGESTISNDLFKPKICPNSTPDRKTSKTEKKEPSRWFRSKFRSKPSRSVSSAEDESGFSSMSSFQEVGIPLRFPATLSPVKGCHTEVGLPEIPIEKIPHRRWSSTPAEFAAMFKRHSAHFTGNTSNTESLSVWV